MALNKFIKNIEDSRFDCEYESQAIINAKQREIDQQNVEALKKITHNQEQYVEIQMSEEFMRSMWNF